MDLRDFGTEMFGETGGNATELVSDPTKPTKANILAAYEKLVSECEEGDVVFCHFSGKLPLCFEPRAAYECSFLSYHFLADFV